MKKLSITGNPRPVIGQKEWYSVSSVEADWLTPSEPVKNPLQPMKTEWGIMVQTRTGWKRARNDKEGETVPYTFGQKSLLHKGIRIVVRQGDREGELTVHPQRAGKPAISKVELLDVNYRPIPKGKKLSYRDTVIARAYCVEMFKMQVSFTLWEDDARGAGHHPAVNALNRINSIPLLGSVDLNGIAEAVFRLPAYTMAVHIANARTAAGDRSEGALHEYYVTADVVSASIEKASPNINVVNPAYMPPPSRQRTWPVTVLVSRPVADKPKPALDSPKFPVTVGGRSQGDGQGKILSAEFVDTGGNRLHASRVGTGVILKIMARGMKNKKVQVKIWEEDNLTWTNDLLYEKDWILTGDENYIGVQLTGKMFDKARDGGSDSRRQDYFIEVLYAETSVTSAVMAVTQDAAPTPVVKGKSVSVIDVTREERKEAGKCPRCDKPVTPADLKTIFPQATDEKLKIVAETYTKYMKDLQMNTCWNKAHFFAQAKIESGDALSLKEGENFNYAVEALPAIPFKTFQMKNKDGQIIPNDLAFKYGRVDQRNIKLLKTKYNRPNLNFQAANQKMIANIAYSNRKELGNTGGNDGWNYRGRGMIQLTGRINYQTISRYTLKYLNVDILKDFEKVGENMEIAVLTSMGYLHVRNMHMIANGCTNSYRISNSVGKDVFNIHGESINHVPKQNIFDNITSKVFKISNCLWSEIKEEKIVKVKWHHPLDKMELRGWYSIWAPKRSIYGKKIEGRTSGKHGGLDLYAPVGTLLYACIDGEISDNYSSASYGNVLIIKGKYNGIIYYFFYAHMQTPSTLKIGDPVKAGDIIGYTGKTGNASSLSKRQTHLHFEVKTKNSHSGYQIDPFVITELRRDVNLNPDKETQN